MSFLIIGLGNPGATYEKTRHNVGWEVVDKLATCNAQRATWKEKQKLHAETLECDIAEHRVTLAKPTTFMNDSGTAVAALLQSLPQSSQSCDGTRFDGAQQLAAGSLQFVIIHDDLDLPVGTLRLSSGNSSGGQKGVQSIIDALGSNDFLRLRIGIGPNTTPDGRRIPAEDFVLKRFAKTERPQIDAAVAQATTVMETQVRDGMDAAKRVASS